MLDLGISGWMVDFAEYIPTHAANNLGMDVESFHNIFPDIWAKCNLSVILTFLQNKANDTVPVYQYTSNKLSFHKDKRDVDFYCHYK